LIDDESKVEALLDDHLIFSLMVESPVTDLWFTTGETGLTAFFMMFALIMMRLQFNNGTSMKFKAL